MDCEPWLMIRKATKDGLWTVIDGWKAISEWVLEHNLNFLLHIIICLIANHYERPC